MRSHFNCRISKVSMTVVFGVFVAIVAQFLLILPARADCDYEGQQYKTGEKVGPYVCMPDGKWQ